MGKNSIGSIVKNMITAAGINDRRRTNHSVRKTTMTNLLKAGFQPTEVMQITGHNNVQSINNYRHLPIKKQKEMSAVLSVPSVQVHLSDDFEEISDEYLSQAVKIMESTHLDLNATTVDISSTATVVNLPIQFNRNGAMTFQSQEKHCSSLFQGANFSGNITIDFTKVSFHHKCIFPVDIINEYVFYLLKSFWFQIYDINNITLLF